MNDEHVRAWLEERPLEELTAIELAEIRARLSDSPVVREALAGRLRLEQSLHQTVGQVRLPVELLLAKAAAMRATGTVTKLLGWGSVTGLMIGFVGLGVVASRGQHAAGPQPAVAVERPREPASPSDLPARVAAARRSPRPPGEGFAPRQGRTTPASREWRPELPLGAAWNLLPAGRVELLAEDTLEESHAICQTDFAIGEITVELEDPVPGTGLYVTDAHGKTCRLAFVEGHDADQVCFVLTMNEAASAPVPEGASLACPPRVWLKLNVAEGVLRGSFSCDGTYWSPVRGGAAPLAAPLSTVGLYCAAGAGSRWVRVAEFGVTPGIDESQAARDTFGRHFARVRHGRAAW